MNLRLARTNNLPTGIFGELFTEQSELFCVTLEHAYQNPEGLWISKIPAGTYQCRRGWHQLHSGPQFETFEVLGVPGHVGILFHKGNFNKDSEGCILLGSSVLNQMITKSEETFARFMNAQTGVDEFTLIVS